MGTEPWIIQGTGGGREATKAGMRQPERRGYRGPRLREMVALPQVCIRSGHQVDRGPGGSGENDHRGVGHDPGCRA